MSDIKKEENMQEGMADIPIKNEDIANESNNDVLAEAPEETIVSLEKKAEEQLKQYEETIAELNKKILEGDDKNLRLQAEMQNYAKRSLMELEKVQKFAIEKFSKELLVIVDTLEMSLKHSNPEKEKEVQELRAYREGMELTFKSFIDTLKKFNIAPINGEDRNFNPDYHEAIHVAEGEEDNKIIEVVKTGYTLNDRVIRPSLVVVSKKPQNNEETITENENNN